MSRMNKCIAWKLNWHIHIYIYTHNIFIYIIYNIYNIYKYNIYIFIIYIISLSTQEARNFILEMAATCRHSSGRKWPPAFSCHRQPLPATCSHSSGRKWPQVAASILFSAAASSLLSPAATCSLLQPLEWPQVAASGRLTSSHGSSSTFSAANCSHSSGRKWPQVAAWHPPTETFPHFPRLTHTRNDRERPTTKTHEFKRKGRSN